MNYGKKESIGGYSGVAWKLWLGSFDWTIDFHRKTEKGLDQVKDGKVISLKQLKTIKKFGKFWSNNLYVSKIWKNAGES